ncbi:MAG: hypothetical protein BMS9Abin25_0476 [Gammaproteobacteria bacterium]|nr:MAG: hypothetical protein BMS9Abin25_0476 [Gammaproteobacteria bacterium]
MYEKCSTQAGNRGLMTAIDSLFRLLPHFYNDHDIMKKGAGLNIYGRGLMQMVPLSVILRGQYGCPTQWC